MKTVTIKDVYLVESEPGDATRYEYLVFHNGDDFVFSGVGSTFKFPSKINIYDFLEGKMEISESAAQAIAMKYDCNFYTVMECCRTALEIIRGDYGEKDD